MTQFQYLNQGNTEAQDKLATSFLLAQVSTGKAATGVLSGLAVTQTTTASGSVLVGAGACVVQAAVLDGADVLVNDSQLTLDVFTANPMSSLARNDIVVFDTATTSIRVIVGTPSATPSDPTVPTSAVPLARLRNAGSATTIPTSAIDDLRTFTSLFNVSRSAAGSATLPSAAASTTVSVAVTFPTGRFTTAPKVTVQNPANFSNSPLQLWVTGVTTTGCTINGWRSATWGPAAVDWIAVQA